MTRAGLATDIAGAGAAVRLEVPTCIACGARFRGGDCPDGCVDEPLDLVEAADVQRLGEALGAGRARIAALRQLASALVASPAWDWPAARDRARSLLAQPALPEPEADVVEAWGCLRCGRVDAPQPCLGVCVRRPVVMAQAGEYRALVAQLEELRGAERELAGLARLVAQVHPRPGGEDRTRDALRSRAGALVTELRGAPQRAADRPPR